MHGMARILCAVAALGACIGPRPKTDTPPAREINPVAEAAPDKIIAITGAMLFDGHGTPPVLDAVVIVRGSRILAAGPRKNVKIPAGAEIIDATGQSVLPGLIDVHFHLDGDTTLPALFLQRGITSLRDPGAWIEAYEPVRNANTPIPRLFLTGPHLDAPPPAYPIHSLLVLDPAEARAAVDRLADQGASAIKIYYRLPLGTIRAVNEAAHARGLVTTAHLEIVNAADAILAGTDGIEHVTSFGTALTPLRQAEAFRQAVIADNDARVKGRYELWANIDLDSPRVNALLTLLVAHGTFFCPTLAIFERQANRPNTTEIEVRAFSNMIEFVRQAHKAGVRIVVGSHADVPFAERGFAYARELELLHEAGMSQGEIIKAATLESARFLRADNRLGTIEPGKTADLILASGDPQIDLSVMRNVDRVMLNGVWVYSVR